MYSLNCRQLQKEQTFEKMSWSEMHILTTKVKRTSTLGNKMLMGLKKQLWRRGIMYSLNCRQLQKEQTFEKMLWSEMLILTTKVKCRSARKKNATFTARFENTLCVHKVNCLSYCLTVRSLLPDWRWLSHHLLYHIVYSVGCIFEFSWLIVHNPFLNVGSYATFVLHAARQFLILHYQMGLNCFIEIIKLYLYIDSHITLLV